MPSQDWRTRWVTNKCEIARKLADGEAGATYSEAAIVVSSAITALAAEAWPGRGKDKVRFIELLVKTLRIVPSPSTISVPLLIQHLRKNAFDAEAEMLQKKLMPYGYGLVVTGSEVDTSEDILQALCPSISIKILRTNSYACVLYEELRSSYAHQYKPGIRAESWPMTMKTGESVSYVNKITERRIHFHLEWLTHIAICLASALDSAGANVSRSPPSTWWIEATI